MLLFLLEDIMGKKRTILSLKLVELHIKLPRELSDRLNKYLVENKALTKTEVVCNALNSYLKNLS